MECCGNGNGGHGKGMHACIMRKDRAIIVIVSLGPSGFRRESLRSCYGVTIE